MALHILTAAALGWNGMVPAFGPPTRACRMALATAGDEVWLHDGMAAVRRSNSADVLPLLTSVEGFTHVELLRTM